MCVERTDPHIRVLWGVEYVMMYLICPTPEDRKVMSFARDVSQGQLPTTVEVNTEWLHVE